ncbi:MAG: HPF/RaiA family ribosome-associated protein [Thiothrix sp.]|nr:MAG: HPF/RaiA family ribosome-associated protein [Thiothrix sp.]
MQIDIQTRKFSLTSALRTHAEQRLRSSLTFFNEHIRRVVMRLSDINGPRGGADKRCHLQVVLNGLPDVVVEDIEADLYIAIDRAADRAGHSLARKIDRRQTLLKQSDSPVLKAPQSIYLVANQDKGHPS